MTTNDLVGLLKGTRVLTLQNRVSLSNLTSIRSLTAGSLTARAWDTLRAAVQGATLARAVAPIFNVAQVPGGLPEGGNAAAPNLAAWANQDLPRMRRGAERC
jgi:hypothetical protein